MILMIRVFDGSHLLCSIAAVDWPDHPPEGEHTPKSIAGTLHPRRAADPMGAYMVERAIRLLATSTAQTLRIEHRRM